MCAAQGPQHARRHRARRRVAPRPPRVGGATPRGRRRAPPARQERHILLPLSSRRRRHREARIRLSGRDELLSRHAPRHCDPPPRVPCGVRRARGGACGRSRLHAVELHLPPCVLLPPRRRHIQLGRLCPGVRGLLLGMRRPVAAPRPPRHKARRRRRLRWRRPCRGDALGRRWNGQPPARESARDTRDLQDRRQGGRPLGAPEDVDNLRPPQARGGGGRGGEGLSGRQGRACPRLLPAPAHLRRSARSTRRSASR